jgi:hypothetical protein
MRRVPLDLGQHDFHRLLKLHLGGVEESIGLVSGFTGQGGELDNFNPLERPAVGFRGGLQLFLRLRERDVEPALALGCSLSEEMQRNGGLASPWKAIQEEDAVSRQTSAQDRIQPPNSYTREGSPIGRDKGVNRIGHVQGIRTQLL